MVGWTAQSTSGLHGDGRERLTGLTFCRLGSHPQYKILLHGCWYELFGGNPTNLPTELDGGSQGALSQPLLGEQSLLTQQSPSYSFSSDSPLDSCPKYPPLYPPGRIIHLEEEGATGR
jgi:sn1-specific diacylglycerol lipase